MKTERKFAIELATWEWRLVSGSLMKAGYHKVAKKVMDCIEMEQAATSEEQQCEGIAVDTEALELLVKDIESAPSYYQALNERIALAVGWKIEPHGDHELWFSPDGRGPFAIPFDYIRTLDAARTLFDDEAWGFERVGQRYEACIYGRQILEGATIGFGATEPLALCAVALKIRISR